MKKTISYLILLLLICSLSCSKDEVVNTPPEIKTQTFTVAENVNDAYLIGKVLATDANQDALKFSLKSDTANIFEIEENGEISLLTGKSLDFETKNSYTITVEVSDGKDNAEAQVTVTVTDINENTAPVINAQTFTVAEDIMDTTEIAAVLATDAEGSTLSFSITTNDNDLFEITTDGKLSLATSKVLDYETKTSHTITVEVTDGSLTVNNTITINVTDVVEVPTTGAFITTWQTTTANEEITIKKNINYTYNYNIDWGDGTTETNQTDSAVHTYTTAGIYTVKITGIFPSTLQLGPKLKSIEQWGTQEWKDMVQFFQYATAFEYNATDIPNLSNVQNMGRMFEGTNTFNGDISNWDVSNVTSMHLMFKDAKKFNIDISNWNVAKVQSMKEMFHGAQKFNQNLNNWDVSSVTNMELMFREASRFNGNINNWNVSNVTNMIAMFSRAVNYNQPLNNWNVGKVTDMRGMFGFAEKFNQDLNNWDVSKVTDMLAMFDRATNFNGNISTWNVANVTRMTTMFQVAKAFAGDISTWNVGRVTNMSSMFSQAENFNSNISGWDVSKVTITDRMFASATVFNQDLSSWDVSSVNNMSDMFNRATSFNANLSNWNVSNAVSFRAMFYGATNFSQDLSSWDISKISSFSRAEFIFDNSGMNTNKNYTKTLIGWSKLATVPTAIKLGGAGLTYCTNYSADAATARDFLINTKNWKIENDTVSNTCN